MDTQGMIELLKLYYEEWIFRQETLWKRIVQFFVIIFFVSTLPITYRVFGGVNLPDISMMLFPITGAALTIFFIWFCLCESKRIAAIDKRKELIISDCFPAQYGKTGLPTFAENKKRMSTLVPIILSIIEFFVSVTMIVIIVLNKLTPPAL